MYSLTSHNPTGFICLSIFMFIGLGLNYIDGFRTDGVIGKVFVLNRVKIGLN